MEKLFIGIICAVFNKFPGDGNRIQLIGIYVLISISIYLSIS